MKSHPKFCVYAPDRKISNALQLVAAKAGFHWYNINMPYVNSLDYLLFNVDKNNLIQHDIKTYKGKDCVEVTIEQAMEYFLNDNVTWAMTQDVVLTYPLLRSDMDIGNTVSLNVKTDGIIEIEFNTLVNKVRLNKEEVDQIISTRQKLLK